MTSFEPALMNDVDQARCFELIGTAMERLQSGEALRDEDRANLHKLIGVFASCASLQGFLVQLTNMQSQLNLIEMQLATLQPRGAPN